MSTYVSNPDDHTLDEVAAEWLFEREAGFTPDRAREFAAWCAASPQHAAAVTRVECTLSLLDELPAVTGSAREQLSKLATETKPKRRGRVVTFPRAIWATSLAAAFVLGSVVWWRTSQGNAASPQHYVTDATVQRSLALPDGTVMDLNTASDVAVHYTPKVRQVLLAKGEAHFQVAHNTAQPFVVTAGDVTVRAVGTAFDVHLTGQAVDVVVAEGKVEIARTSTTTSPHHPLVAAGERLHVVLGTSAMPTHAEPIDPQALHDLLTWQTSMATFSDVPLRDVVVRFNRRNATRLIIDDPVLGRQKIGGKIALDQVDAFVRLLEQDGDIVADRSIAGQITLRRSQ